MKKLIIVNGTMGVGKSTTCQYLLKILQPGVYLDGDWCWNMNPFAVTEENKAMVIDNITYLLRSFLNNSGYEYVIFCWVIHEEEIFDQILQALKDCRFELHKISLVCSEDALRERIQKDVESGVRQPDVIDRSVCRIPLYERMNTVKIDVSSLSAQQTAEQICKIIQ